MADGARRVRVAAVNDYDLIVAGVAQLLSRFPDWLSVCDRVVIGEPIETPVDVALYDTYGRVGIAAPALRALAIESGITYVAMFSLDLGPDVIAEGRAAGAAGFISKALSGDQIAAAIVRVAAGEPVVAATSSPKPASAELTWPGKDDGLTERESQVLVLVAEGLSNREIAAALYLSLETVKGYLREIFNKLGLRNRVEATNYVHRSGAFVHRAKPEPA
ncbi:MAG: response regulator transcription factor [Actinomycetia bacterium]|nr:response regulator transcription factor [Actinomycetes bacterium]